MTAAAEALLKEEAVARWLSVSTRTLRRWRDAGTGPVAIKLGPRSTRYRRADVEAYIKDKEAR